MNIKRFSIFVRMNLIIYNISIFLLRIGAFVGAIFSDKTKEFVNGRKRLLKKIESEFRAENKAIAWFHCASLGEFEQGRPVIEAFKKEFPHHKIILTFFSPSGYEVRKNYVLADFVYYLPLDTASNAKQFINTVNPSIVFFVKYEFWYHYLNELKQREIPVMLFSAIFRNSQIFFKPYGGFYKNILKSFTQIFVQDKNSVELLKSINIKNTTATGDTRFDSVWDICQKTVAVPVAKAFKSNSPVMVIGSSWPEDHEVLIPFINQSEGLKFIIAPHEIKAAENKKLIQKLHKETILFSRAKESDISNYEVLIIDNIGMLSSLYQYGDYAYIGGAFGSGLHNILEAATFGLPIFFGNRNYKKFNEANELIAEGSAFVIEDTGALKAKFNLLNKNPAQKNQAAEISKNYVRKNTGATITIVNHTINLLKNVR